MLDELITFCYSSSDLNDTVQSTVSLQSAHSNNNFAKWVNIMLASHTENWSRELLVMLTSVAWKPLEHGFSSGFLITLQCQSHAGQSHYHPTPLPHSIGGWHWSGKDPGLGPRSPICFQASNMTKWWRKKKSCNDCFASEGYVKWGCRKAVTGPKPYNESIVEVRWTQFSHTDFSQTLWQVLSMNNAEWLTLSQGAVLSPFLKSVKILQECCISTSVHP